MKTVYMLGKEQIEVVDIPEPELKDDLVVVRIMASGICGTEYTPYYAKNGLETNSGHEAAAIVWKTSNAKSLN
jgi:L-iditol 2-dehydrogenase